MVSLITRLVILSAILFTGVSPAMVAASSSRSSDALLKELKSVVANRDSYREIRERRIDSLKLCLKVADSENRKYDLLGELLDEYYTFNADSAYNLALVRDRIARQADDPIKILTTTMNRADVFNAAGMYKEAAGIMDALNPDSIPSSLRPYYFHIYHTLYVRLAEYSAFEPERQRYRRLTDIYRDSLIKVNPPGSFPYALMHAGALNDSLRPAAAVEELTAYMKANRLTDHDRAMCAWVLSESYGMLGDTVNQKEQLIISSINDLKMAVREYISLRRLAQILSAQGESDLAYEFLSLSLDDAAAFNSHHRISEISDASPIVNSIYVNTIRHQRKELLLSLVIISVLFLVLAPIAIVMRKQMKRISDAKTTILEAYESLNEANARLTDTNTQLTRVNSDLAESSQLKEEYICRYMDQCLGYIDRLDRYRISLNKLYAAGRHDQLQKELRSATFVDKEFKAFYESFDSTFLKLFPTFVEEFNSLLLPGEEILPKKPGILTTELRIYALVRLGITDSDKIAKFLRYSLTTIYNYRVKVRNKSRGDRNQLEEAIMMIGRPRA